jgi:hypothetical protein
MRLRWDVRSNSPGAQACSMGPLLQKARCVRLSRCNEAPAPRSDGIDDELGRHLRLDEGRLRMPSDVSSKSVCRS